MRLIADAKARGERGFLLGNSTGTGKTFVTLGAIKQLGMPRTLIVVPNQGIAQQWQDVGKQFFGLDLNLKAPRNADQSGVFVTTYADLRLLNREGGNAGTFGLAVFDEVHREGMKLREKRQTAVQVNDLANASDFALYSTATPIERSYDAMYLAPLGLWQGSGFSPFKRWSEEHGTRWDIKEVRTRYETKKVYDPKFMGSKQGKVHDMLRIRAEIVGQGKGVFRELKLPVKMASEFASVGMDKGEFSRQVRSAIGALEGLPTGGLYAAARVNLTKRLLDYIKLEQAVDVAEQAVKAGKSVPIFVSNVSPFRFDLPDDTEEVKELGAVARRIRTNFAEAGLSGELPSPVEYVANKLRERLGDKAIGVYTGEVSAGKREKIKQAFNEGSMPVVIATIAAGGTGLSLHDTAGNRPRHQVNIGLPWSGKDFSQLLGRTYRHGTKSDVTQHFLLAEHPYEQQVAGIVAGKAQSMGATVHGITADTNVDRIARFSTVGAFDAEDEESIVKSLARGVWLYVAGSILQKGLWLKRKER